MDLVGRRFGKQIVIARGDRPPRGGTYWLVQCDCGSPPREVFSGSLLRGRSTTCGCFRKTEEYRVIAGNNSRKHGHGTQGKTTLTYRTWLSMHNRVRLPESHPSHRWYGHVDICERWHVYTNFLEDMGERPSAVHTIDRRDGTKGYFKDNCRWATKIEQAQNRSSKTTRLPLNIKLEIIGRHEHGESYRSIAKRFSLGANTIKHFVISHQGSL